jgi:hypothetical protein
MTESFAHKSMISDRELIYPGGIVIGNVRSRGGRISSPTISAKTTGDSLAAADIVGGLIVINSNAGLLTLSIPNVEVLLAAFQAAGQTMGIGDQFSAIFIRGSAGAGDCALAALAAVPPNHAVTWVTGAAPMNLTSAGAAYSHVCRLIFEVTELSPVPAIQIHAIVG